MERLREYLLIPLKLFAWLAVIVGVLAVLYWTQVSYERWRAGIYYEEIRKRAELDRSGAGR